MFDTHGPHSCFERVVMFILKSIWMINSAEHGPHTCYVSSSPLEFWKIDGRHGLATCYRKVQRQNFNLKFWNMSIVNCTVNEQ